MIPARATKSMPPIARASPASPVAKEASRILVVEDHPFVREGIVRLIERQNDLRCCGEAETISETPALAMDKRPDLVLLDLNLKDGEAFSLIPVLRRQSPSTPVLILSHTDDLGAVDKALQLGARGYVLKGSAIEETIAAIRAALRGEVYLSPELSQRLQQRSHSATAKSISRV